MRHHIKELKVNSPIKSQPYFSRLIDGQMSLEQFKVTQLNILPAVSYFSLPMFYLCTRLESYEERINILENINGIIIILTPLKNPEPMVKEASIALG